MDLPRLGKAERASLVTLLYIAACAFGAAPAPGAESHTLAPPQGLLQRVQITLAVEGNLKLLTAENKEHKPPLQVSANFVYEEKIHDTPSLWAARHYQTATAEITLGKSAHHPRLAEERRLVGIQPGEATPHLWSPGGPLTRDEAELLDVQANSVLLAGLLPREPVKIGDSWSPEETVLARFLTVGAVSASDVKCKLAEVNEGRAVVEMAGKVSGAAEGAATEIQLAAKFAYHLAQRRFTGLTMAWKESRAAGQAEPGFEVSARLTMALTPLAASEHLTEAALASLQAGLGIAPPFLHESAEHGFRVLLDARWRVIMERPEVCVLRLIDDGQTVAQCNVSSLPPLEKGRRLQLEEFQQDIQKALAENFGQFIEASQSQTGRGLRVLRAAAAGQASELPIHWIYYHVSDDEGRRLTYVFTLEAEKVERFGGADGAFTSSLELFAPTAKPVAEEARRESPTPKK